MVKYLLIMRAIIVAFSRNHVIGNHGKIPWMGQLPADMKRVRKLTRDQAIIMGLNTFKSIGRPLPQRQNIVLTPGEFAADGVEVAHSLEEAFAKVSTDKIAFIFGGASVYRQAMEQDLADEIFATEIHEEFDGDAFFPEISRDDWREASREDFAKDDENHFPYSFVTYERRTK